MERAVHFRALRRVRLATLERQIEPPRGVLSLDLRAPLGSSLVSSRGDSGRYFGTLGDTGRHEDSAP